MKKIYELIYKKHPLSLWVYDNKYWVKRIEVGQALDYKWPGRSINKLYSRNKDKLISHSAKFSFPHSPLVYSFVDIKGVEIICSISEQPNASHFYNWFIDSLSNNDFILLAKGG